RCYRASNRAVPALALVKGCLRPFAGALFCPLLKGRAISSVVERLLHTQEVAGSNPTSRILLPFAGNLKRHIRVERSPRRQVAGSNPVSRMIILFAPEANNLQK